VTIGKIVETFNLTPKGDLPDRAEARARVRKLVNALSSSTTGEEEPVNPVCDFPTACNPNFTGVWNGYDDILLPFNDWPDE
jgi:hypothetical protein